MNDYLRYQIEMDARARDQELTVFVILALLSLFLGLGLGRFLNQADKVRILGARWVALIVGAAMGGIIGLLVAKATQTSISGMALVGASILGLTGAQRACTNIVSAKFVFGFLWVVESTILWLGVHGKPASKVGSLQLLAYTGIAIGIVQIIQGIIISADYKRAQVSRNHLESQDKN